MSVRMTFLSLSLILLLLAVCVTSQDPITPPVGSSPVSGPAGASPTDTPPISAPVAPSTTIPVDQATKAPVAPPTSAPVDTLTLTPVVPPSDAPIQPPTLAPVVPPTSAPVVLTSAPVTSAPVTSAPATSAPVTSAPVTSAPVTSAPITSAPVTVAPTSGPSSGSSSVPTIMLSEMPSPIGSFPPTLTISLAPSALGTGEPSGSPSTIAPSEVPSIVPGTVAPSAARITTFVADLSMNFAGMSSLTGDSIELWQETTRAYVETFYKEGDKTALGATDLVTRFTITKQDAPASRRLIRASNGRALQGDVTLTYTQDIAYRPTDPEIDDNTLVEQPFVSLARRLAYIEALKATNDATFDNLISVSNVRFSSDNLQASNSGGLSIGAIIGIAIGGAAGFCLLMGGLYYMRQRSLQKKGYFGNVGDAPPAYIQAGNDEVSTIAEPAKSGAESLAGYGDQPSVTTVDYDYSKAYGGGADHSVSSAGGTFGSNPQALGANQGAVAAGASATLGSFSDDGSFGEGAAAANVREELLDIYAPAGKLGVVIDTPDDGAPVVHAIKDSSVIADKLQVGDKLVAVDDEDVRTMTAIKVSKLISRKSGNPSRKLSIIRTTLVD